MVHHLKNILEHISSPSHLNIKMNREKGVQGWMEGIANVSINNRLEGKNAYLALGKEILG
jgi:hypothetical protein